MKKRRKNERGFTLIELLVVITVLVILATFLVPQVGTIRERGRRAKCLENLRILGVGLHTYAADNDGAFPTDDTAEAAFRKIYVQGNITDPLVFACPSTAGKPTGTPGAGPGSPSLNLTGVDFQYNTADLADQSTATTVIASDKAANHTNPAGYNLLHVAGNVSQSDTAPSGTFG